MKNNLNYDYKFNVNRPLDKQEPRDQLKQEEPIKTDQHYWGSLIKMNSCYLEVVDPIYQNKGELFMWTGIMIIVCFIGTIWLLVHDLLKFYSGVSPVRATFFGILEPYLACGLCAAIFFWVASSEIFSHTHRPVRLNRKTRMIHVFRPNGTVLSVPWDKVFFTLGLGRGFGEAQDTYIAGHILDPDGKTVRDTFVLGGYLGTGPNATRSMWEFFRRYMEEGVEETIKGIPEIICLPVDRERESYEVGLAVIQFIMGPQFLLTQRVFKPLLMLWAAFRWVVMRINKVPVWPKEIEDACPVDPKDPHCYDVTTNPPHARFGY